MNGLFCIHILWKRQKYKIYSYGFLKLHPFCSSRLLRRKFKFHRVLWTIQNRSPFLGQNHASESNPGDCSPIRIPWISNPSVRLVPTPRISGSRFLTRFLLPLPGIQEPCPSAVLLWIVDFWLFLCLNVFKVPASSMKTPWMKQSFELEVIPWINDFETTNQTNLYLISPTAKP